MKMKYLFLIILFICANFKLLAQDNFIFNNFIVTIPNNITDSIDNNTSDTILQKIHSPKKATLLSTFLPGAGQIYNKQVWKVPVIYLAAAGVTYFAITNGKNKNKFKDEYYNRINGKTDKLLRDYTSYTNEGIYNLYNSYKRNFQLSIIVGVMFYAVQIVDAYVYGHLFNFDITDNLSMNVTPYYNPSFIQNNGQSSLGISFSLNF